MNNNERIEVLRNAEIIMETYLRVLHNVKSKWDYFADIKSLSALPFAVETIKDAMLNAKRTREIRLRFITEFTKDNIPYCKEAMETVELRHLDGVKGNFGVSDNEYIAVSTTTSLSKSDSSTTTIRTKTTRPHAVYSNVKEDIQQQQYAMEQSNTS